MIRAVLFDLDGTLYDRDAAILRTGEEQFEAFCEQLGSDAKSRFLERLVELDAHGHNRRPGLHHVLAEEFGLAHQAGERLESYFRANYPRRCRPSPDTLNTLETLRARGMKLGIITNGPAEWQGRKVDAMGIARFFDTILISGVEGIEKPDPRIFARALDRCGVLASESMFVGDHPEADIAGARAAGLVPVWKRMPYWKVPDDVLAIGDLSELLPVLSSHKVE